MSIGYSMPTGRILVFANIIIGIKEQKKVKETNTHLKFTL
jgi:hypothetical protein